MLRGDLATTPLDAVLRDLASTAATGCLHLHPRDDDRDDAAGDVGAQLCGDTDDEARVYLCAGRVCAAFLPGWTHRLGNRLVSLGLLPPDTLAAIPQARQGKLIDWQLAELLVDLGCIGADVAEDAIVPAALEELHEAVREWSRRTSGRWRFRRNQRCHAGLRRTTVPPQPVDDVLAEVGRRHRIWAGLLPVVGGLDAVPALSAGAAPDSLSLDRLSWALLCKADGVRSIRVLAFDCGLSRWEAARTIAGLVKHGVLDVVDVVSADKAGAEDDREDQTAGPAGDGGTWSPVSAIAAALAELERPREDDLPTETAPDEPADSALLSAAYLELAAAQQAMGGSQLATAPTPPPSASTQRAQPVHLDQEPGPTEPTPRSVPAGSAPADVCDLVTAGQEHADVDGGLTDRFRLLRELSSLGVEDARTVLTPPSAAAGQQAPQQPRSRQQPTSVPQRKRKGLFSRG